MQLFRIEIERNPVDFEIVPISDIHFGSVFCDEKSLKRVIDYIKSNPNTYFYLGGDILDAIPLKDKRFEGENLSPIFMKNLDRLLTFGVEYASEFFEPVKDKCLWIQSGNHEEKYYREYGFDFISLLAKFMNVKNYTHSYEVISKILIKNNRTYSLTVYSHHGFCNGRTTGPALNSLTSLAKNFEATVYVMGHSHKLFHTEDTYFKVNSSGTKILKERRLFIGIGGFRNSRLLNKYSYEEKKGFYPSAVGTLSFYIERLDSLKLPVLKVRRLP